MLINEEEILPHAILGFKVEGTEINGNLLNKEAYIHYRRSYENLYNFPEHHTGNYQAPAKVDPEYGPNQYQVTTTIRTVHPELLVQTQIQDDIPKNKEEFLEHLRQDIRQYTTNTIIKL